MTGTIKTRMALRLMLAAGVIGCAWGYYGGRQDGYLRGGLDALKKLRENVDGR